MTQRLGWLHWLLSRFAFAYVHIDPRTADRVRELAKRGTVVYVLRHRSVADYLLVRSVLARENLPPPEFANGVSIGWFRSLGWILRRIAWRLASGDLFRRSRRERHDHEAAASLVRAGAPILVFLRRRATGIRGIGRPFSASEGVRFGNAYLEEVLRVVRESGREVFALPLAPLRGRGYKRRESRVSQFIYSVRDAPNEAKKLLTFLFNRRDLSLTIGREIRLAEFVAKYAGESEQDVAHRLGRVLLLFLHREERVVWGPPLLPKREVREIVIGSPPTRAAIEQLANERGVPVSKVEREARAYFDEMAASFSGVYFSFLTLVFRRIWNRMFGGIVITGLERVADRLREHPVVLVPCHRSHFDYLILSFIFHSNFLSPPHIAAGINLSFFPMGMLFRGAGAFFIRRTFGDNELYKIVFREYLGYLIREGTTQEFFIEGGRSRTGKIMTPKLGMLGALVDAFLRGVRRDLYFVPVSISYDRLVEEEAYKKELLGAEKEKENLRALVRARSVLKTNYGGVHVDFGEPISLDRALGGLRAQLADDPDDPELEREKRRFVLKLGFRLLGEVNEISALGAAPIAATVLLSSARPAILRADFLRAAELLVAHAEREGARFTAGLARDRGDFVETIAFLESAGLVKRVVEEGEGEILAVPEDKRVNLDFYRNNGIHLFVVLGLASSALMRGIPIDALGDEVRFWLELFRNEFVLPERDALPRAIGVLVGRLRGNGGRIEASPLVRVSAGILTHFFEAYWVAARRVLALPEEGLPQTALVASMRRSYAAKLMLGICAKPEGNTTVTLENAIRRFEEMRLVRFERAAGAKENRVLRGDAIGFLAAVERRLEAAATAALPGIGRDAVVRVEGPAVAPIEPEARA
jgi:glycerol-3-phosphate O-acyltransferase